MRLRSMTLPGACMVAVLVRVDLAAGARVPLMTKVSEPPCAARSTVCVITGVPEASEPLVLPHFEPVPALQLQLAGSMSEGIVSVNLAPTAGLGPVLLT